MTYEDEINAVAKQLVLCQSPDGWSLHEPGSTDEQIATGDAPPLLTGEGEPTQADYECAAYFALGGSDE